MATYFPKIDFNTFMGGGKTKKVNPTGQGPTTPPMSTANNPYTRVNGQYYDMGGYDYQRALPPGMSGPMWNNGQYGYWNPRAASFEPFTTQPTRVSAPPTPGSLQRTQMTNEYQKAMDEAKRMNEERYQQALGNLEGVGEQERADINTRFDSSRSAVNQGLVSSGLAGTTVAPSMQRGVERERTGALNRLAAMLAREKNQVIIGRDDLPPDLQAYINLMYQTGTGGNR